MLRTRIPSKFEQRNLFAYLRVAFNKVDPYRLSEVGPDRLCAEWILKNGGFVRFLDEFNFITNYNSLPSQYTKKKLIEVDATDSSIMALGFDHFKNCNYLEKIKLHKCKHMENEALDGLQHVKDTLIDLEVSECYNVNESGLLTLKQLIQLKRLTIFSLPYVKDWKIVEQTLKTNLPNCDVNIKK